MQGKWSDQPPAAVRGARGDGQSSAPPACLARMREKRKKSVPPWDSSEESRII